MSNFFKGYDAYKLATPPEYEEEGETCDCCDGTGVVYVVYDWHGHPQDGEHDCQECGGTGVVLRSRLERDPDDARDAMQDRELDR